MCYMLLELETLLVVPSHAKNKIGNRFLASCDIDWVLVWWNICFCFENRLILKSPKIYVSVSLVLIFEKCSVIVSVKLPWFGGR